jgi:surface protein
MNCWDVRAITDMSSLFSGKWRMNEDIGCWDVSNVITMYEMFYEASSFNQDIGNWNVSSFLQKNLLINIWQNGMLPEYQACMACFMEQVLSIKVFVTGSSLFPPVLIQWLPYSV